MRLCHQKPNEGYYTCGNGITVNGIRYCSDYGIQTQKDYAGHVFCADCGKEIDDLQVNLFSEVENDEMD